MSRVRRNCSLSDSGPSKRGPGETQASSLRREESHLWSPRQFLYTANMNRALKMLLVKLDLLTAGGFGSFLGMKTWLTNIAVEIV